MTAPQTIPKGWSLTGKNGAMDGNVYSLEFTNVLIGTDSNTCSIVYPAGTLGIEPQHCQLTWKNDCWYVISLADSGTWLNDKLLKKGNAVPINPDDRLSLANAGNNFIIKQNNISPPPPQQDTWTKFKENFLTHKGRLNREAYLLRIIAIGLINMVNWAILLYLDKIPANRLNALGEGIIIALLILWLICVVIALKLDIRRLHDTDHSGWWVLTCFIPFVNFYTLYLLIFKKGTEGDNRFGSDPLNQRRN